MIRSPDPGDPSESDEAHLLVERLDGATPKPPIRIRLLWRLAPLMALLVLFGVGAANLWPYSRPAQQATSRAMSQATIIPPTPSIPAGWEHLGPADASRHRLFTLAAVWRVCLRAERATN